MLSAELPRSRLATRSHIQYQLTFCHSTSIFSRCKNGAATFPWMALQDRYPRCLDGCCSFKLHTVSTELQPQSSCFKRHTAARTVLHLHAVSTASTTSNSFAVQNDSKVSAPLRLIYPRTIFTSDAQSPRKGARLKLGTTRAPLCPCRGPELLPMPAMLHHINWAH